MFWLLATALTLMVAIAILRPFWRSQAAAAEPAAAFDLRIYRDQLAEVERDLVRGIISQPEADRLRAEIGRKVLGADQQLRNGIAPGTSSGRHGIAAVALLAILIGAGWFLYSGLGAPSEPDMGLQTRIEMAEASYASRPSQLEAEAQQQDRPAPAQPDPAFAKLMEQLRAAVKERPDDLQGLALLAQNEARIGNVMAAKEAQARLVELKGEAATSVDHALLAGLMTEAAGGLITPEAEAEIQRALQLDADNPQARYMIGLLQAQNGRPDRAFPVWAALLEETSPDSPWNQPIRQVIGEIAWLAGRPDYQPPSADIAPGPDADAMAAAADMSPEDREAFIRSMVEQLESRLGTEGGSPEEWARLITSLGILGDIEHAAEIHAEARTVFADLPDALELIDAAAQQAGTGQ